MGSGSENFDQRRKSLHWLSQIVAGRRKKQGLLLARAFGHPARLLQRGLRLLLGSDVNDKTHAFERFTVKRGRAKQHRHTDTVRTDVLLLEGQAFAFVAELSQG